MNKFHVGDVVQFKSGGPKMTVVAVLGEPETPKTLEVLAKQQGYCVGDISCKWFDGPDTKGSLFKSGTVPPA
ncbi:DUF2158 domain-containing protein [Dechloromonas sp. HYN0024]|uniref:DUF2158 domain-containing protein n=1 Tax=Dechloromonas sp. HYN0024 TaxID=2231055 RepID=UPI000E443FA4|nr:DUF2158 domain-containing protein [Dechloromonas sp. HYN0024]AXS79524.1 DUF2158 domain-containing protein [Dechloromonas sp. HYN0024]